MKGDKKFFDEQASERELEREEFTRRIETLEDILRRKEKEEDGKLSLQTIRVRNIFKFDQIVVQRTCVNSFPFILLSYDPIQTVKYFNKHRVSEIERLKHVP